VDLLAVTEVSALLPPCPRVLYVILSHCPLWGPPCPRVLYVILSHCPLWGPPCPRVLYVILSHCPLWGPRRWHRLITQIVLMVGVFP
jgi:hypothetical protein